MTGEPIALDECPYEDDITEDECIHHKDLMVQKSIDKDNSNQTKPESFKLSNLSTVLHSDNYSNINIHGEFRMRSFLNMYPQLRGKQYRILTEIPFSYRFSEWMVDNFHSLSSWGENQFYLNTYYSLASNMDKVCACPTNRLVKIEDSVYFVNYEETTIGKLYIIQGFIFVDDVSPWDSDKIQNWIISFSKKLKDSDDAKKKNRMNPHAFDGIFLPENILNNIIGEINDFLNSRELYKEDLKLPWKRGYMLIGPPGNGKAQPLYSKIKTPNGWITMGEIKIGDEVCTPDGKTSNVIDLFPQGIKDVYRITFEDGRYTDCCGDHLWKIYGRNWRKTKLGDTRIMSLNSIIKYGKYENLHIQLCKPIYGETKELPISPYILGSLIANGHLGSSIKITSSHKEFLIKFKNQLIEPYTIKKSGKYDYNIIDENYVKSSRNYKNQFDNFYKQSLYKLNLLYKKSYDKFIPDIYMTSSVEQRIELVQGLMDNDGFIGKTKNIEYCTSSYQLSLDVQYLIRSIGGICNITSKIPKYTYKGENKEGRLSYSCHIKMNNPEILFSVGYKLQRVKERKTNKSYRNKIKSIEYIGKEECQCILIDHPDHLYITDDFIVTHNTSLIRAICNYWGLRSKDIKDAIQKDGSVNLGLFTNGSTIDMILHPPEQSPVICIMEDIDKFIVYQSGGKGNADSGKVTLHDILKALDGMDQHDGVIVIATTNYARDMSEAILNRPGRFDRIWNIDPPTEDNILKLIKYYGIELNGGNELDFLAKGLKGFSMAFVAEFIKRIKTQFKRNNISHDEAMSILDEIHKHNKLYLDYFKGKDRDHRDSESVGFGYKKLEDYLD